MTRLKRILDYFAQHNLLLVTAESCTAGEIIHSLAKLKGSGQSIDVGYVVYSAEAKQRLLNVKAQTIKRFNLTSEEVAREMVEGALHASPANVAVATTGVAGPQSIDDIQPGTVCFGWGFKHQDQLKIFSLTKHFDGSRAKVLSAAAFFALQEIPTYHAKAVELV